jgi:hypothetical protein
MRRILIALVIGLLLLEAYRLLYRPPDESAAAGVAAYKAGDYARAEARFRQAEQAEPRSAGAAHNHAAALYQLARFDDADHDYQRSAEGDELHAARADYDRGNCAFREACAEEGTADPALVERAAKHYEDCLVREGNTPPAGTLFDDARHNLELAKLILAEFAESGELKPEDKPPEPDKPALARDGPGPAPDGARPPGDDGQPKPPDAGANAGQKEGQKEGQQEGQPEAAAKGDGKEQTNKPAQEGTKSEAKGPPEKDCPTCKRGGCPACKKKPGKGPGNEQAPSKGDGPKPNPGDADNGKAPGKGKAPEESSHPDPGGGKGKPGEGGTPSATDKNGVGDAKSDGTGPADPGQSAKKKGTPSQGKTVGPDGVGYERQDQPAKDAQAGEGNGPSDPAKPPQPGGKDGSPRGAPGEGGRKPDATDSPPAADVDKLFKPGTANPAERKGGGSGGTTAGSGRLGSGQAGQATDSDITDGNGDPVERAAARRLRQAVQRIQKGRESRQPAPAAGKGDVPNSDRRRDW